MSILSKLNVLGRLNSLENRVENIESKLMNYNIRLQEVEILMSKYDISIEDIMQIVDQHEEELKRSEDGLYMLHKAIMEKLGKKSAPKQQDRPVKKPAKDYNNEVEMPTPNELNFLENILKRQRLAYFSGSKASRKDVRAFLDIWGPVARGARTAEQAFRLQNN